jgi:hypothetical protein
MPSRRSRCRREVRLQTCPHHVRRATPGRECPNWAQRPHSKDPDRQRSGRSRHETETSALPRRVASGSTQPAKAVRQANLTSSSGRSRVRSSIPTNQELGDKARLETALESSQAHGKFRTVRADAVTPEGLGCYCVDQNAVAFPGGPTPPKGPIRISGKGAQRRRNGAE